MLFLGRGKLEKGKGKGKVKSASDQRLASIKAISRSISIAPLQGR